MRRVGVRDEKLRAAVLISAGTEWRAVLPHFPGVEVQASPLGAWFVASVPVGALVEPVLFFHGGWGKIPAAASTQYVIDRWQPDARLNLGTCGGIEGEIARGEIVLAERTVVYDIVEQMGDPAAALARFATDLPLEWLVEPYPQRVRRTLLVSADRDLIAAELPRLKAEFGAVAGDWESGAIAYVAARHGKRCLILRGVTDLVGPGGGEAYGALERYAAATRAVMADLLSALPVWLALILAG